MRYKTFWLLLVAVSLFLGCGDPPAESEEADADAPVVELGTEDDETIDETSATTPSDSTMIELTPENTQIGFVGTHIVEEGPDPDARSGQFEAFQGTATMTEGMLSKIAVEIETSSLQTENEKLTGHLKSPDFFDVREHPNASFTSTSIEPAADGEVNITGDLTLLGNTKTISFPATVSTDGGFELNAEFTIDRTEFGMDYGVDKVEKTVTMTIGITSS